MKYNKKLLQLLQRTFEADDPRFREFEHGVPMAFIDLGSFDEPETIDVIEAEPVVVMPRVYELTYVPAPEELQ